MNGEKVTWRQKLTRNLGLKIISFLFAVTLWLVVVNIDDPVIKWSFLDVPVTIKNADVITSQGMIYEVLDDTDVVPRVTVYAPRSIGENLLKSDIVATADMNSLNSLNTLQIDFSVPRVGSKVSDIRGSIDNVKVSIENKKTIQKVLKTDIIGDAPEGYIVGNAMPDQNLVRISGPESVVNRVESAAIQIDMNVLSEFTSDITTSVPVRLYDEEGNEVEGKTLSANPENVMITVEILPVKDVLVVFEASGEPESGYGLTGQITVNPKTIRIAGRKAVLNGVNEIRIPAEALDISGISEETTREIDIRSYLPEGVIMADKSTTVPVSVTVGVEKEITNEYELRAADVKLSNVPAGFTCILEGLEERYTVTVTGIRSEMTTVTARNLEPSLDIAAWMEEQGIRELLPGTYRVELQFTLPEHVRLNKAVSAVLLVSDGTEID